MFGIITRALGAVVSTIRGGDSDYHTHILLLIPLKSENYTLFFSFLQSFRRFDSRRFDSASWFHGGGWEGCELKRCVLEAKKKMNGIGSGGLSMMEKEYIRRHHRHQPGENQCVSALVKHIRAPVPQVALFLFCF